MHLHIGELLLAAVYLAAALLVLVGIFRTHATKSRQTPTQYLQPPLKRVESKPDPKKDRKAA